MQLITTYYNLLRKPHDYSTSHSGLTYSVDHLREISVEDIQIPTSSMYWEIMFKIVHREYTVSPLKEVFLWVILQTTV